MRLVVWAGGIIAVGAAVGLGVFLAVAGLGAADQLASVIGGFVGLAGLGIALYGLHAGRSATGNSIRNSSTGDVVQADTVGDVRFGG